MTDERFQPPIEWLVTTMAALDQRVKCVAAQVPGMGGRSPRAVTAALDLATKQARGEIEPIPIETGKMTGKMERYSNMRVNPAKSIGFSAVESAEQIKSPIIFIVAENEELSNNDTVEAVHKGLLERGVPSAYHVIKGITHYGIYREGFEEATKLEVAFFQKHLQGESGAESVSANSPAEKPLSQSPKVDAAEPNLPAANGPARSVGPEAAFRFLDADKDGQLSESELAKLEQTVPAFRNNPQAISQFFKRLDSNGDGTLSLDEYMKISELQPRRAAQNLNKETNNKNTEGKGETKSHGEADQSARPLKFNEAAQLAHFEKNIRPVLVSQCYQCHSAESNKIKGGLALDTREATLAGGDSGPAVVPGDATKSLLIAAIKHTDGLEMPPKKKLTDKQISDFVLWIDSGALDPRETKVESLSAPTNNKKSTNHWAYKQPSFPVVPTVTDQNWVASDIDRFIVSGHEKGGVKRNKDAAPDVLVRRLYFDLTGLPPTPQDVKTFVELSSKDRQQAIQSTVDQLLSSERFGERWGRHWLDVARFAESSGKETNFSYPHAWRYRDYVIDSFNRDVPFDQFIREQLAGDLLPADDDQRRAELLVATGFLALGSKSHIERNKKQFELDVVDEQIDTVTQAFMGVSNPSHPELLDYLAITFVEQDKWSVKSLIRRIVSSRVYQLDSETYPENFAVDPDNKLLWRVPPRRLDAEEIRDSMLFVAGVLELERPIGSVVATGGEGYTGGIERFGLLSESKFKCRSVYLPVIRGRAFESMDVFDGVDGSMVVGKRDQTETPKNFMMSMSRILK